MEIMYKENTKGYRVLTPDGYKSFAGIRCLGARPIFRLEFINNRWIECTNNHKLFTSNQDKTPVTELQIGDTVLSIDGELAVTSIVNTGRTEPVYDLIEVEDGYRYYTNSLLSSNCEFIINDETLIAPAKLLDLQGREPTHKTGQVRWYEPIRRDQVYVVALDPSLGTGGDPAAIQVFEANTTRQVGEWRHNRTPIPEQVRIMADIIKYIYDTVGDDKSIYYSVENNTIGEAALISIAEWGEENIKGYFLSDTASAGPRRFRKGFNTTNKSKLSACSKLKNLVESGRMTVNSKSLVSEFKNFVAHGTSYAAKPGETDDLIMATILAVRMLTVLQSFYIELDSHMRDHESNIIEPFPFISMVR
jgi:hypothetical protein